MTNGSPEFGSPTGQVDWEALARYLAGESSAEEADAMRAWLAAHPGRADLAAALDRSLNRLGFRAPADLDVEGALRRVRARRDEVEVRARRDEVEVRAVPRGASRAFAPPAGRWRTSGLRIAAAVAAIAAGVALWQSGRRDEGGTSPVPSRTFATAVGERDSVSLPDGSTVLLGPGSRLTLAQGYGAVRREVELQGEAYFDVRHDAARPFAVHAGAAMIRDLGTVFAVHSDLGDGVRVVVTSGAVALHVHSVQSDSGVVLRAGDLGMLDTDGRVTTRRAAVTDDDLAWTRGRLIFSDAPIAQVSADLRRWYGVEMRVADSSLARRHLTASFAGEPVERVLEVIALTLGADVERRGDTAVLLAARTRARPR
jgi:transmembrane sensor